MQGDLDLQLSRLAQQIGVPLVLLDQSYNVRAFTPHRIDADPSRAGVILRGSPRSDVRSSLTAAGVQEAEGPVRTPKIPGAPMRILLPLRHQQTLVGFVSWLDENHELIARQAQRSEHVTNLAQILYASWQLPSTQTTTIQLITGRPVPFEQLSLLQKNGYLTEGRYSVACLRLDGTELVDLDALLTDRLTAHIDGVEAVILPQHAALEEWHEKQGLAVGVGPLMSIMELSRSWKLAQYASRIAARGDTTHGRFIVWDELGIERVFGRIPFEDLSITDLPTSLQKLLAHRRGPDLADTLLAYLDRGGDASAVAQSRGIGRSTVYHRLDRAEELSGVKRSDGSSRLDLHAGLRLAQIIGLMD